MIDWRLMSAFNSCTVAGRRGGGGACILGGLLGIRDGQMLAVAGEDGILRSPP